MLSTNTDSTNICFNTIKCLIRTGTCKVFCVNTDNKVRIFTYAVCNIIIKEGIVNIIFRHIICTFKLHLCHCTEVFYCSFVFVYTLEGFEIFFNTSRKPGNTRSKRVIFTSYRESDFVIICHFKAIYVFYFL